MKVPHDPDEIVAVVDENDQIISQATRKEVHDKRLLHREVAVHIVNAKNEILLQKRADNGKWDSASAGHFPKEDNYMQGALREIEEELGIMVKEEELQEVYFGHLPSNRQQRLGKMFLLMQDRLIEDFVPDPGEVVAIKYFSFEEVKKLSEEIIINACKWAVLNHIIPFLEKNHKL